ATLLTRQDFNEFFFTHFLHSLFSGKDRDLKIQRQRVLYRGLTIYIHLRFVICDKSTKIMLAKREQRCFSLFASVHILLFMERGLVNFG
ncbi:hypothetical protein ACMSD1_23660, partial [Bacteroides thetaiotaomicron]|uniref:hypothetical protein n=1 Tax=Bacteroides thetaiotaomicron TaxID=818 RepID=UPI0039C431CE